MTPSSMNDTMTAVYTFVVTNAPIVLQAIGAFAVVATKLPKPADNSVLMYPYKLIQFCAMNFGRAQNVQDTK